jgi:hypothetical protein
LNFYESGAIDGNTVKILKTYLKLKNSRLLFAVSLLFRISEKKWRQNLNSPKPSLFLFDLYRLGYLSSLKPKDA